jgi:dihydropteroate synthase
MFTLNCKGRLLVANGPMVMGIINTTPDSFYAGSRQQDIGSILEQAGNMLDQGADLLDIGGQSTRPGSQQLDASEEMDRVMPAITAIIKAFPDAIISVDTYYAEVAKTAVEAGVRIINDISAGELDDRMLSTVAALQTPYVCMHMKGRPQSMQVQASYEDVLKEVLDYLVKKLGDCRNAGILDVIIDPGFGFGKTIQHNFLLLKQLSLFKMLETPVLVGLSRKSTIYKTLGITPEKALNGTTVLNTLALANGADILRVHDVQEAREAILLFNEYNK